MQPINTISVILFLGLEFMVLGHEDNKNALWHTGLFIMLIGWILNILSICGVFK